jgi:hypothetical protein
VCTPLGTYTMTTIGRDVEKETNEVQKRGVAEYHAYCGG